MWSSQIKAVCVLNSFFAYLTLTTAIKAIQYLKSRLKVIYFPKENHSLESWVTESYISEFFTPITGSARSPMCGTVLHGGELVNRCRGYF